MWFSALDILAGVLGSREAGRVPKTPASTSSAETICSFIRSSAPEDGNNDARNTLSEWIIYKS